MKKIILILLAFNLSGAPYESAQRFSEGDTISAEVLNDILDRIELSLKPIEVSELPGTWEAKQYWCGMSLNDPTIDATQKYANEPAGGPWGCNGHGARRFDYTNRRCIQHIWCKRDGRSDSRNDLW